MAFVSQGISQYDLLNRQVTALALDLTRDGKSAGVLTTEKSGSTWTAVARRLSSLPLKSGSKNRGGRTSMSCSRECRKTAPLRFAITFNPLVRWVWLGGGLMALGGLDRHVAAGGTASSAEWLRSGDAARQELPPIERELAGV